MLLSTGETSSNTIDGWSDLTACTLLLILILVANTKYRLMLTSFAQPQKISFCRLWWSCLYFYILHQYQSKYRAGGDNKLWLWSMCFVSLTFMFLKKSIDLSSLFNWNTKLLFVYLTAEYESEENVWQSFVSLLLCNPMCDWSALPCSKLHYISFWNHVLYYLSFIIYNIAEQRVNQVVVWDTIIKRAPDAGKLSLRDLKLKYPFYDYGNNLK